MGFRGSRVELRPLRSLALLDRLPGHAPDALNPPLFRAHAVAEPALQRTDKRREVSIRSSQNNKARQATLHPPRLSSPPPASPLSRRERGLGGEVIMPPA